MLEATIVLQLAIGERLEAPKRGWKRRESSTKFQRRHLEAILT
jgi:hypothetical protein